MCMYICVPLQVTPRDQLYLQEVESREEGGTPAIIGSIRAGLAMQLKESVGVSTIMTEENTIFRYVYTYIHTYIHMYVCM